MRPAPSVNLSFAPSRARPRVEAAALGCAAAALVAWTLGHLGLAAWPAAAAGVPVAVAWAVVRGTAPGGVLAWDGQGWQLDGTVGELRLMLDFDTWLLVRFGPVGQGRRARRWLLLHRPRAAEGQSAAWHGLRAALYSRPSAATLGAPPEPPGPSARPD